MGRETIMALSSADMALGRLGSAAKFLRDPNLFVRPYIAREAVASSRIEGTQASLSDVFQAAAAGSDSPSKSDDVQEVQNYIAALDKGLALLDDLPPSQRLISEIHRILMRGVRGRNKRPGEIRDIPVHIGSTTDSPETAIFVPPLTNSLPALLSDWENYLNESPRQPILIQCALMHYQFETIHPFMDGNGRLGRLLIVLFLVHRGHLPAPLLYVSSYLEQNRRDYYDRLQGVRERGEIEEWIQFFLTAVTAQADDAVQRAEELFDLREKYRTELAGSRSRATEVVDLLFENPFMTATLVSQRLEITAQGARNLMRGLEKKGWLEPLGNFGPGGRTIWVALEIFGIINRSLAANTDDQGSSPQLTLASPPEAI
jgi:Fic family protein